jgi:Zn ribbon nucleic-acid-binding protein
MRRRRIDSAGDILTCSKCGEKTMLIYVEENQVQRVKCARCGDLVAYTSELIRILDKT